MSIKRDSYDSYDSYRVGYLFREGATKKPEKNEFQAIRSEDFYYFAIVILSFKRNWQMTSQYVGMLIIITWKKLKCTQNKEDI